MHVQIYIYIYIHIYIYICVSLFGGCWCYSIDIRHGIRFASSLFKLEACCFSMWSMVIFLIPFAVHLGMHRVYRARPLFTICIGCFGALDFWILFCVAPSCFKVCVLSFGLHF